MTIDAGKGMRSADIPDGFGHLPDRGTCPVCWSRDLRIKADGGLYQHWKYGWPRKRGYPPCAGTGQQPTALNETRVTRYLAQGRYSDTEEEVAVTVPPEPTAQAAPVVWILSSGEMHEGGRIIGAYLDRDLAAGRFITEAATMGQRFGVDSVEEAMDGGITVESGCDWLTLAPHTVITRTELD